jgi:hypothetical protein
MLAGEEFRLAVGASKGPNHIHLGSSTVSVVCRRGRSSPDPAHIGTFSSRILAYAERCKAHHRRPQGRPAYNARKEDMNHDSDTTIEKHTYTCALPTRGGVCNCQAGHNPSINPWPQLSGEQYEDHAGNSRPPASPFRPGGPHQMFSRSLRSDLLVEEQQPAA